MKPHIFYKNGWWRVTRCESRAIAEIRLWNMAHQFVTRLHCKRPNASYLKP